MSERDVILFLGGLVGVHRLLRLLERYARAMRHPLVNIVTHPANRMPGRDEGYALDFDALFRMAVETGTALEIDGGPGHLDPRMNDGRTEGSQGIVEDPSWEPPLFGLFDAIRASAPAALLAVCHTFGVMCRWLGAAEAVLRGPAKGGKSAGVVENILTDEALAHPCRRQAAAAVADDFGLHQFAVDGAGLVTGKHLQFVARLLEDPVGRRMTVSGPEYR